MDQEKVESAYYPNAGQLPLVRKWHQIAAALAAAQSYMSVGMAFATSSFLLPQLQDEEGDLKISPEEGSWFASIIMIGCIIGSILGGFQCDLLGRKKSLLLDNVLMCLSFTGLSFATNIYVLLIARFLQGYSSATILIALPVYINEITQTQIRPLAASFTMMTYCTGFGLILLFGATLPWRLAVAISGSSAAVAFLAMLFLAPESPYWSMTKGKDQDAADALMYLRGEDSIVKEEVSRTRVLIVHNEVRNRLEAEGRLTDKLKAAFSRKEVTRPFVIVIVCVVVGVELSGMPTVAFYLIGILKDSKLPMDPYWAGTLVAVFRAFISIFVSGVLLDRVKRRTIILSIGLVVILGNALMCGFFAAFERGLIPEDASTLINWLPLFAIILINGSYSIGYSSIIYNTAADLMPPEYRSKAGGIMLFADNLAGFMVCKFMPSVRPYIGLSGLFGFFVCTMTGFLIYIYFRMPETFGKSFEEIEEIFRSDRSVRSRTSTNSSQKTIISQEELNFEFPSEEIDQEETKEAYQIVLEDSRGNLLDNDSPPPSYFEGQNVAAMLDEIFIEPDCQLQQEQKSEIGYEKEKGEIVT